MYEKKMGGQKLTILVTGVPNAMPKQYTCNLKITELVFTEPKKEFAS